jgi:1-deoxy-D-xylulose-5-phosphate synthase
MHLPDRFIDQDKPEKMYAQAGLDADAIVRTAFSALGVTGQLGADLKG